jgi:hypothetical protein
MSAKDVNIFLRRIEMINNRIKPCISDEDYNNKSTDNARITKIIDYQSSPNTQNFYVPQCIDVLFNHKDN